MIMASDPEGLRIGKRAEARGGVPLYEQAYMAADVIGRRRRYLRRDVASSGFDGEEWEQALQASNEGSGCYGTVASRCKELE